MRLHVFGVSGAWGVAQANSAYSVFSYWHLAQFTIMNWKAFSKVFHLFFSGFAVFADSLKSAAVGAPGEPGLRMRSPDPALMRSCLARMFAYRPGLFMR